MRSEIVSPKAGESDNIPYAVALQSQSSSKHRSRRASGHLWESMGVLRLAGELRNGQPVSAGEQLMDLAKVTPRTARKALSWLEQEGIITVHTAEGKDEIVISFEGLSGRGAVAKSSTAPNPQNRI